MYNTVGETFRTARPTYYYSSRVHSWLRLALTFLLWWQAWHILHYRRYPVGMKLPGECDAMAYDSSVMCSQH